MVAWWPLDEAAGPTAHDIIGSNDGAHVDGPTPTGGMVTGALNFDGLNDHVNVPDNPSLNFGIGQSLSIDLWAQMNPNQTGNIPLIDKRQTTTNTLGYTLWNSNGNLAFQLADGGTGGTKCGGGANDPCSNYVSTINIADGAWHHVAVTLDRVTHVGRWYLDGMHMAGQDFNTATQDDGSLANTRPLLIAEHAGGCCNFSGILDEIEIFDRVLTDQEVLGIFAAGSNGKCNVHAGDLDGSARRRGVFARQWQATTTVEVHSSSHQPLAGAVVTGVWTAFSMAPLTSSCTTDATGRCNVTSLWYTWSVTTSTFTVNQITHASGPYNATGNHDPEADSNGTAITILRP